jgi:hypothetical protein
VCSQPHCGGRVQAEERDADTQRSSLTAQCGSVEAQVAEFSRVLQVMVQQPQRFHLSDDEMSRRREFVAGVASQVTRRERESSCVAAAGDTEKEESRAALRQLVTRRERESSCVAAAGDTEKEESRAALRQLVTRRKRRVELRCGSW